MRNDIGEPGTDTRARAVAVDVDASCQVVSVPFSRRVLSCSPRQARISPNPDNNSRRHVCGVGGARVLR